MQDFTQHVFNLRATAREAADDARNRLWQTLNNNTDGGGGQAGAILGEMFHLHAYARWWDTVIEHIEQRRIEVVTALTQTRTAARQTLLDHVTPRTDCPFTYGQQVAFIEATRHFYHDTASLHAGVLPPAPNPAPASRFAPPAAIGTRDTNPGTGPHRPM